MATRYEHLFELSALPEDGTAYLWTGPADLTIGGTTYKASNWLAGAEQVSTPGLGDTETRMTLRLFVATDDARARFIEDPGAAKVKIGGVYSTDDGSTWTVVDRAFSGRVSGAVLRDGVYEVDVVSRAGDPFRRYVRTWSDVEQQRRYPGDTGFSRMAEIAAGIDIAWPYRERQP